MVEELLNEGIEIESYDEFYENGDSFEEVYEKIALDLVEKAKKGEVVYAVPGHPLFAEKTVEILLKMLDNKVYPVKMEIHSSMSFLDVVITSLKIDPINGFKLIDALEIVDNPPDTSIGNIITQVYNKFVASEVKLTLLELYDPSHEITLLRACGVEGKEVILKMPIYELDRIDGIDYLTTLYVPPSKISRDDKLDTLFKNMEFLRSENGCPWDREQTHESLKRYLIEEAYEVVDAIDKKDYDALIEELGDVLLHIVFHCQIGKEDGVFEFEDVVRTINKKLIHRHPHIFSDSQTEKNDWEEIKREEKGFTFQYEVMEAIPKAMQTLYLAEKVQRKAADVGFDWNESLPAIEKIIEEGRELKEAIEEMDSQQRSKELGDLLFSVVNVARILGIDPDEALRKTIEKFISRFKYLELELYKNGTSPEKSDLKTMDELWEQSKRKYR